MRSATGRPEQTLASRRTPHKVFFVISPHAMHDDQAIQAAISTLEATLPAEGGQVRFEVYGGGPEESKVVANKVGYLRLGLAFLKAAYSPPADATRTELIHVDLAHLTGNKGDVHFSWFERRENVGAAEAPPPRWLNAVPYAVLGGCGLVLILAIIGVVALVRWLT